MDNIKNLYKKLWMSLIKPRRTIYSEEDLGGSMLIFETGYALRLDFQLKNVLNEQFYMSIYFPCNEKEEIPKNLTFIIYCHTHNGCRVEGLGLLEKLLRRGLGLVVFDFRSNGFSGGSYVTLGWLEALDINTVCLFLKKEVKARSLILWGRSMGACATIFFLSPNYRKEIDAILKKRHIKVEWLYQKYIDCLILDSPFSHLQKSIHHMVKCKASKTPGWLVNLTVNLIDGEVKKKAGISLFRVNPATHVHLIKTPVHLILGTEDELVESDLFYAMFRSFGSKIKKISMFNGSHADERPEDLQMDLISFAQHILELKKSYLANKESNLNVTNTNMANVTHNYLDYTQIQLHKNYDQNVNRTRLITPHRSYIPVNKNANIVKGGMPNPKNVEEAEKFAEMKKTQLSRAFKFSVKPVNLEDDGNQFDPQQIMKDNEVDVNIDRNTITDFVRGNNVDKEEFEALKLQNPNNISGLKNLSLRFVPKMNINERLVSIRPSHRKNVIPNKNVENSFEAPIVESKNKGHTVKNELKTIQSVNSDWNSHKEVYVPQYTEQQHKNNHFQSETKLNPPANYHSSTNFKSETNMHNNNKSYNLNTNFSKHTSANVFARKPDNLAARQKKAAYKNPLKMGFNNKPNKIPEDYIIVEDKNINELDIIEGKTIYIDVKGKDRNNN